MRLFIATVALSGFSRIAVEESKIACLKRKRQKWNSLFSFFSTHKVAFYLSTFAQNELLSKRLSTKWAENSLCREFFKIH